MSQRYVLPLNDPQATLATVGGKGASLARLANAALPVPGGFHVTTEAYRVFVEANDLQPAILAALEDINSTDPASLEAASIRIHDLFAEARIPADIAVAIRSAYAELPNPQSLIPDTHPPVAVRSSATAEDLPEASFAGQQETFLNVNGADAVLEATVKCWASLWTVRAIAYRARQGIPPESVTLAVVVQLLVPAVAAGILFTADPVTGRRDQVVISAAWGLGEAIVGGLVTPDSLTVDKATGRVLERQTADKRVMTVRADGGTHEQPVPEHLRRAPVLDDAAAAELAQLAVQIENLYGMPMDIEWAVASSPSVPFPRMEGGDALPSPERRGVGGGVFILQARPITALPAAPELLPPTRWQLPRGAYAAMRNNIIELMAEPLTPLFGSLGRTAINTSFNRLLTNFFGRPGILPPEPIIMVNEYAYYNGSLKPGALLRLLAGSVGIMKRMHTGALERWTETGRPHYLATVARWQAESWRELPAIGLLDAARELTEAAIDAYGALVSGAIPAAWISEALFTAAYNRLIRRRDDPPAPTFLLGFDSTPIRAEKSLYDLA